MSKAPRPSGQKSGGSRPLRDNPKVAPFVERFLTNGHNATDAARHAGYTGSGIRVNASRMMQRSDVKEMIAARAKRVAAKVELTGEAWAREVAALAFSSIGDLYDDAGQLIPIHLLPPHVKAAIAGVRQLSDGSMMAIFGDKNAALAMAAKHLGLFEKDNSQRAENVRVTVNLLG